MDCKNCELKQRQFYCSNCLRSQFSRIPLPASLFQTSIDPITCSLRDFRLQTQHFAADRDEQVARAAGPLEIVSKARIRRAGVARWEESVWELDVALKRIRRENETKREQLKTLRQSLSVRRQNLAAAKLLPPSSHDPLILREANELAAQSTSLARARSGLVQELVEVFNIVEVGGRPPVGGRAGTKGEWAIGDLVLPVPGDIRRYPPTHINAVITHAIHFLGLLTFYLGVKLPFEITWSENKLGVGQPWIGAGPGTDTGNWAKWSTKHPLHFTSSPIQPPSSPSSEAHLISQTLSDSFIPAIPPPQTSFTTAFAMLLYNVCYLAHTQSVDIPLSQAGFVLSNLWAVCCSAELGRRAHATYPFLPPPTPPTFSLDFTQLLQATSTNPASRKPAAVRSGFFSAPSSSKDRRDKGDTKEGIQEEEEGWDLVESL